MSILFWSFGILGVLFFHMRIHPPIIFSVVVFVLAAWYLIRLYTQDKVGPLTLLLFIVYALPFIHIVPYNWFDFETDSPSILWGLAVNPYMIDRTIIELMSMIGAVGAAGFAAGASLMQGRLPSRVSSHEGKNFSCAFEKTLPLSVFCVWVAISVVFTWITAPEDTVFSSVYTESKAISHNWGFSSAWMFSYAFLIFAVADSIFERSRQIGRIKRIIIGYTFLVIVLWFQLLRGDRESLTCVVAVLLMFCVWGRDLVGSLRERTKTKSYAMVLAIFAIAAISHLIGFLRSSLVGMRRFSDMQHVFGDMVEVGALRFDRIITGTWSGVLLTPLSVAGDYVSGTLSLKHGQTYLDLIASIMPGFVANWIGYTRPIDGFNGPAWEMTYGVGGTHAVVVPFMNFRMVGVFTIIALWSFACARLERYSIKNATVSNLALLGTVAMAVPHWLWYGEKNIINALIIWLVISFVYKKLVTISQSRFYLYSSSLPS